MTPRMRIKKFARGSLISYSCDYVHHPAYIIYIYSCKITNWFWILVCKCVSCFRISNFIRGTQVVFFTILTTRHIIHIQVFVCYGLVYLILRFDNMNAPAKFHSVMQSSFVLYFNHYTAHTTYIALHYN